jgi:5-bromo-4-chloroindolyl phosphate hydrolysis protein
VAPNEEKFYTLTSLTKQLLYTINGWTEMKYRLIRQKLNLTGEKIPQL